MNGFYLFLITILFCSPPSLASGAQPQKTTQPSKTKKATTPVDPVLTKFQKTFDGYKSYRAKYNQIIRSKALETDDDTSGTLYIFKPDKFRWQSTDGALQIINGKTLTLVQPKARHGRTVVDIYTDYTKMADPKLLNFLTGKLKLKSHFNATLVSDQKGKVALKLTSKDNPKESYTAEIEKKRYLLTALIYETSDTITTLRFSDIKIDFPYDKKLFEYKPGPKDIVHTPQKKSGK